MTDKKMRLCRRCGLNSVSRYGDICQPCLNNLKIEYPLVDRISQDDGENSEIPEQSRRAGCLQETFMALLLIILFTIIWTEIWPKIMDVLFSSTK